MAPAFLESARPIHRYPRETNLPVTITCLQWDCDGALKDQDRELILQNFAAIDPYGGILMMQISHS